MLRRKGRTGRFAHQIKFVVQVLVKFSDHLARLEAFTVTGQTLNPPGHQAHQTQVFFNHRQHARPQDLHRDLAIDAMAVFKHRKMDLRNGGAGDGLSIKGDKNVIHLFVKGTFNCGNRHLRRERWHPVLQQSQLIGNVHWHQVSTRGENLAQLDKNRA